VFFILVVSTTLFSVCSPQAARLRSAEYEGPAARMHEAALWFKAQPTDALVMCRWANMLWYWTGIRTTGIPRIQDPERMWSHILERHIDFLVVDSDTFSGVVQRYLQPAVDAHAADLEEVARFGDIHIYRIQRPH
jgi:hypothetical protein